MKKTSWVLMSMLALSPGLAYAGWTALPTSNQVGVSSARACKTYVDSPYGGLWRVNYQVFRFNTLPQSITVSSFRFVNGQFTGIVNNAETNNQWLYGVVSGTGGNVYASVLYDDRFVFQVNYANSRRSVDTLQPAQISDC